MTNEPDPEDAAHRFCTDEAQVIAYAPNSLVPVHHAVYPCGLDLLLPYPAVTRAELRRFHDEFLALAPPQAEQG